MEVIKYVTMNYVSGLQEHMSSSEALAILSEALIFQNDHLKIYRNGEGYRFEIPKNEPKEFVNMEELKNDVFYSHIFEDAVK